MLSYSAKEWSEGYYRRWDFVDWRQSKKPAKQVCRAALKLKMHGQASLPVHCSVVFEIEGKIRVNKTGGKVSIHACADYCRT